MENLKIKFNTYSAFPPEIHENFIRTYVLPYRDKFEECIDLGCGSGGLIREFLRHQQCHVIGIDISKASINHCLNDLSLKRENIKFIQDDIMNLIDNKEFQNRFDLIMSYSVFHIVTGDTPTKFKLLKYISKPDAIIAIDAIPRIIWNRIFFFFIRNAFKLGIGRMSIKLIGPLVLPNRSKNYIEELSRLDYMKDFSSYNFIDLSYFNSEEFKSSFKLLRLDIVPQDTFFTARRLRFTIQRINASPK